MMRKEDLIAFELDIANEFNAGKIRAPIHLDGGNEDELIQVFQEVHPHDYVFCSWRSHYKALLHGIPKERVKAEIMAGRSISLCFPDHRFFSSAIVGGHLPIALGVAWAIKRHTVSRPKMPRGISDLVHYHDPIHVWAFVGDMAAHGGMFHECLQYAVGHGLPITFVIEDNGKSVYTDTKSTWESPPDERNGNPQFSRYTYKLPWPHSGAGKRILF